MSTDLLIRRFAVSDQRQHCQSRRRPSAAPWQTEQRGFLCVLGWKGKDQEGPEEVFNNTRRARSRSSSREQEARKGSSSIETKTKTKKAKDTKQSSKPSAASEAKTDDDEPMR